MTSTTSTVARCTTCRQSRDPSELLLVFVHGMPSHAVCRPSINGMCFRVGTGPASSERIEPLASYLARGRSAS